MNFLEALFTDETEPFRTPIEPDPNQPVRIRLRSAKDSIERVLLRVQEGSTQMLLSMKKTSSDTLFDLYEASFVCSKERTDYVFLIKANGQRYAYYKDGVLSIQSLDEEMDTSRTFWFMPGFHVPKWSKGAVQYQIFVDRFRNGTPSNDVNNHEYYYVNGHSWHMPWDAPVVDPDIHNFYGGDLQGVAEKLDYLQDLGVEALYFNPIFVSPSSHKYDTQDYEHIDPHFAVIVEDKRHIMQDWEKHNGYAPEYIKRVSSLKNLEESDKYFANFCQEVHRRGMKIILDGVFNHCGSFNKWMDREGIYVARPEFPKGAYQSADSPYRNFFKFKSDQAFSEYEGWWGFETLPKLNYDECPELVEKIMQIGEKWASPPYNIDGWRLDVAADLGSTPEVNHAFWKEFRQRVKKVNPNLVIIAEHYGDASSWLQGDQWDTVMNYDAFMEPLTYFLTGMEKHSDAYNSDLFQNGRAFFQIMREKMAKLQAPSILCAMNQLSNHDHSRFLTRTNHKVGRLIPAGSEAAGYDINKAVLREAVVVQMTWPGAPTLYYGDEAGQVGWTDPDCRRTYPWGHEDKELIQLHHDLIAIHRTNPVFSNGSVKELDAEYGLIAYGRFSQTDSAVVVVNNIDYPRIKTLPVWSIGAKDGDTFTCVFSCDNTGHTLPNKTYTVKDGTLTLRLPRCGAVILTRG